MRRPWIKIETCTPDKPEVCSLAAQLRMDEDTVVGKLVRLWSWAELNRIQPNDLGVTREFIDKLVGRKGFALALEQTGWLVETEGKLSFRNFKRHNSPVAQNKALTAKRVARHRLRKSASAEKVTAESLPEAAVKSPKVNVSRAVGSVTEKKTPRPSKVTAQPLPEPVIKTPEVDEIPTFVDDDQGVITQASTLDINDESPILNEQEAESFVTLVSEPAEVVEEPEMPPQMPSATEPEAVQLEEPTPRKRRGKAAPDTTDQPLLF